MSEYSIDDQSDSGVSNKALVWVYRRQILHLLGVDGDYEVTNEELASMRVSLILARAEVDLLLFCGPECQSECMSSLAIKFDEALTNVMEEWLALRN